MTTQDDQVLLGEYARHGDEGAFATLVQRYVNLVYSAALRFTGNRESAQEITQAVFIVLARKASSLRPGTVLSGWLYQTARLTAANYVKGEMRRQRREQEAYMQSMSEATAADARAWDQIAPLLEEAMGQLGETDRNALVLRFFENKTAREAAVALRLNEDATHKRVRRALEKLRRFFARRGVTLSLAALASVLAARAVQAAPAELSLSTTAAAMSGAGTATSVALAEATLRVMTWLKLKLAAGLGAAALVAGGAVSVVWQNQTPTRPSTSPPRSAVVLGTNVPSVSVPAEEPLPEPGETLTGDAVMTLSTPPGGLLVQPDGKILVAASLDGFYIDPRTGRLGQFLRGAFRLNPDGSLDRAFCCRVEIPGSDAHRAHLALLPQGRLLMSGLFDSVSGQPRAGYALLLPEGHVDAAFVPGRGWTNTPARTYLPGGTYPAAGLPDGSVAVMSGAVEGRMAPYPLTVYRVTATGERVKPASHTPPALFPHPSGLILTLSPLGFWARKPVDWTSTRPAARREFHYPPGMEPPVADLPFEACTETPSAVDAAPVLAALFDEVPLELCRYAAPSPEGKTVLAIRTEMNDGHLRGAGSFMRFDAAWRPEGTFTNAYQSDLRSSLTLKRQPDGNYLVAGVVGTLNGERFPGLARLLGDGRTDRGFHCDTGDGLESRVMDMAVQADGRIIICGYFTKVNGVKCQHLARLNPDGSLDPTFRNPFVSLEQLNAVRFPVQHLTATTSAEATTANVLPAASVSEETIRITSMSFQADGAALRFQGRANQDYILQAREALNGAAWQNVSRSRTDAQGTGSFRDAEAARHPMRFYRVATP